MAPVVVLSVMAVALTWVWEPHRAHMLWWTEDAYVLIDQMIRDAQTNQLSQGGSALLINDPFGTDEWTPLLSFDLPSATAPSTCSGRR